MIKAVILDLDDTLFLTEEACFDIENAAIAALGRPPMTRQIHLQTWGQPLFEAIKTRSPGIDVAAFRKVYEPVLAGSIVAGKIDKLTPQNIEALDTLIALGKQLMVVTSREHGELAHLLTEEHLLSGRVEAFYYKDNMQFHKPDPRAFEQIETEHGWKPEECLYVGDSVTDAAAAKGAGLHFIASLESGLRTKEDFQAYPVDYFINTFADIVPALRQLDKKLTA